ncbi:MAG: acyl-CoA dehydrogenase [Desulfobacterales bacterium]|nr:acyl-CoA dehydrogenase [Desulfobacterales bacterium]
MTFDLTGEQRMIQTMARQFSRNVIGPTASERDRTKDFPADNLKKMGELGLMGMMVPFEYDGSGADAVSYALALSEIAYSCAATAVVMSVQNSIICESIYRYGTEEQKQVFLKPLAAGKVIGAFAMTEPDVGSDPASQTTSVVRDGDYYVINGIKRFITSGKNAGTILVTTKTDETKGHKGISLLIVPKGTPGLVVGNTENKLGLRASDTTDLIFDNCRVPVGNILGKEGDGFKISMTALDSGRIGISAQSVGVARAAFDSALKYATGRVEFGKPMTEFQNLRWMIADMATEIEAAKQLMLSAAAKKDRGETYTTQASMSKLFASEMANRVTGLALQIHGGAGYTQDYEIERFCRDARVFTIYEGTSEIQRLIISRNIIRDNRLP